MSRFTDLIDDLTQGARIIAWSEGVHLRQEYLQARNRAVEHLVDKGGVTLIAAETHFALAEQTNEYLRAGSQTPTASAIHGVWSWSSRPLHDNLVLLRQLVEHNRRVSFPDQVKFCGLDAYGYGPAGPAAGIDRVLDQLPDPDSSDAVRCRRSLAGALERWAYGQQDPNRHGVTSELLDGLDRLTESVRDDDQRRVEIYRRLARHQAVGGDHRDIGLRDDLQYRNLRWAVEQCRPSDRILIFEQVEHLDPTIGGSLGSRLADDDLGTVATIGALWSPRDPTISYPLGRYRPLADWLDRQPHSGEADWSLVDLRPWRRSSAEGDRAAAAAPFDAVVYAPITSPAGQMTERQP